MSLVDPTTPANVQPVGQSSGWVLTFSDEFGGSSLDSTKWNPNIWFASESGQNNYTVSGGTLKIFPTAAFVDRHLCTGGPASMGSMQKFSQTYGYFEARLKMPIGHGCWPAWWMLNSDTGPSTGAEPEIDIMECYPGDTSGFWADASNHPIKYEATYFVLGANQGGQQQSTQKSTGDISTAFHTYALQWTSSTITFYYDGVAFVVNNASMNKAMYLLLSLQFGSASGSADGTTPLGSSNSFEIDYVRVWTPGNSSNPYIDPTTPAGVQPNGFSGGYTLTMSDEFNKSVLDSKWFGFRDFGDFSSPTTYDVNANNNSALRMWWNGNSSSDNQIFGSTGTTPFRQRFGFYEARIQMLRGRGPHSGFWLYPQSDSHSENADGQQQEIDIVEFFSYENGDWLVDTTNFQCKNAKFTVWGEGGGGATTLTGERYLRDYHGYDNTLSTQYHTYGMRWTAADGLQWYFDGVAQGSAVADPWGSGNNMQLALFVQLWWGPSGGNPTPDGNTPASSSNSMLWDYVRVWTIDGTPTPSPPPGPTPPPPPPPPTFTANLSDAPTDGATISGTVHFGIQGTGIQNAELLPPTGYLPRYGTFVITQNNTVGDLQFDTTTIGNTATFSVRISAFDQPQGVATANELVVMSQRNYVISNGAPTPPPPPPPSPPPPPPPTIAFDNKATAGGSATVSLATTLTVTSGAVLVVGTANNQGNAVSAIAYAGVNLTKQAALQNDGFVTMEVWALSAPASGANTLQCNFAGAASNWGVIGASYTGVDPATIHGTIVSTTAGSATNFNVSVSASSTQVVVGFIGLSNNTGTVNNGNVRASNIGPAEVKINLTDITGASTVSLSASATVAGTWGFLGFPLTVAAAPPPPPPSVPAFVGDIVMAGSGVGALSGTLTVAANCQIFVGCVNNQGFSVSAIYANGTVMSPRARVQNDGFVGLEVWSMSSPPTGNVTIQCNFTGGLSNWGIIAATYSNVREASSLGTIVSATAASATNFNVSISASSTQLVVGFFGFSGNSFTPANGTLRATSVGPAEVQIALMDITGTAVVSLSANAGFAGTWTFVGFPVNYSSAAAPSPPPPPPPPTSSQEFCVFSVN